MIPDFSPGLLACASMRPGRGGPGRTAGATPAEGTRKCFNEAGARWPRKAEAAIELMREVLCFNEAGARWPRKFIACPNRGAPFDKLQ